MGGDAFAHPGADGSPPLYVPRMTPALFFQLKERYRAILQTLYEEVVSPTDAPWKEDHGDIDYIVCGPLNTAGWPARELANALGAKRSFETSASSTKSFAVLQDYEPNTSKTEMSQPFVQIDVKIVESAENLRWQAFKSGYSDMAMILGMIIRPVGLTIDEIGLHLRIEEMEKDGNPKRAVRLLLTTNPESALDFLGLDVSKYRSGFGSETEIFEWATSTYLFDPTNFDQPDKPDRSDLRKKMRKRPMLRRFRTTYLSGLAGETPERRPSKVDVSTRQSVLQHALETFPVKEAYHARVKALKQQHQMIELEQRLSRTMRATYSKREVRLILQAWAQHAETNQATVDNNSTENDGDQNTEAELGIAEAAALEWVSGHVTDILQGDGKEKVTTEVEGAATV